MEIKGWKYYNHAAVPTVRINEEADITPVQDGKIWQISGGGHHFLQAGQPTLIAAMKPGGGTLFESPRLTLTTFHRRRENR